jgi:hypothetical protein
MIFISQHSSAVGPGETPVCLTLIAEFGSWLLPLMVRSQSVSLWETGLLPFPTLDPLVALSLHFLIWKTGWRFPASVGKNSTVNILRSYLESGICKIQFVPLTWLGKLNGTWNAKAKVISLVKRSLEAHLQSTLRNGANNSSDTNIFFPENTL